MSEKKSKGGGVFIVIALIFAAIITSFVMMPDPKPSGSFASQESPSNLNNSYSNFYDWITTDRHDSMGKNIGNPYQVITSRCQGIDSKFGEQWTACMQEGYKDYLKSEVFVGETWLGDYTTMIGHITNALAEQKMHGITSETDQWKENMQAAKAIYERIAATK